MKSRLDWIVSMEICKFLFIFINKWALLKIYVNYAEATLRLGQKLYCCILLHTYTCPLFKMMFWMYSWVPSVCGLPWGFPGGSDGKDSACSAGGPGSEDPREKGVATHSILACRIPWTEEPGGLPSMGLQRVGHDRATNTFYMACHICEIRLLFSSSSWKEKNQ